MSIAARVVRRDRALRVPTRDVLGDRHRLFVVAPEHRLLEVIRRLNVGGTAREEPEQTDEKQREQTRAWHGVPRYQGQPRSTRGVTRLPPRDPSNQLTARAEYESTADSAHRAVSINHPMRLGGGR